MEELINKVTEFMVACGQDYTPNASEHFADFMFGLGLADLYKKLIIEESGELYKEFIDGNIENELKEICDLIWVLVGYSHIKGYDLQGAFNEVYRSNMSKVDPETGSVIKNAEGKVLKPPSYSPADMSDFIVITENVQ